MASHKEPVAVIGLGRFGTALALELARGGTEVLAVDNRPDIVQRLSGQLGQVVVADSTDLDALREIGIGDFNRAVVAIGNDLEASILTTALLAELEVRDIWAKAVSRQQATILERIGAHHVVLPEQDMGERVAHLVAGRLLDWVELDPQWVFAKTKPPRELVGVPLGQSGLRQEAPRHRGVGQAGGPGVVHPRRHGHRAHLRQRDRHRRADPATSNDSSSCRDRRRGEGAPRWMNPCACGRPRSAGRRHRAVRPRRIPAVRRIARGAHHRAAEQAGGAGSRWARVCPPGELASDVNEKHGLPTAAGRTGSDGLELERPRSVA